MTRFQLYYTAHRADGTPYPDLGEILYYKTNSEPLVVIGRQITKDGARLEDSYVVRPTDLEHYDTDELYISRLLLSKDYRAWPRDDEAVSPAELSRPERIIRSTSS